MVFMNEYVGKYMIDKLRLTKCLFCMLFVTIFVVENSVYCNNDDKLYLGNWNSKSKKCFFYEEKSTCGALQK